MRTALILLVVVLLAGAALGGWVAASRLMEDGGPGITPTPTGTAAPSPGGTLTPAPTGGPTEGARLVYKEFGAEADVLWLAAAADLQRPTQIAEVKHAPDSGIRASLSPDGRRVAYTMLPAGAKDAFTEAEAWVTSLEGDEPRLLAEGVDLAGTPVWSPDGGFIVVRRNGPARDIGRAASLLAVNVADGSETVVLAEEQVLELFPVGYSAGGDLLYFAEITLKGTNFRAVPAAGGTPVTLVHASDQPARDWHLSPDRSRIAFLASQATDNRIATRAFVARLGEGATPQPLADFAAALEAGDHLKPVWHPDGERIALGRSPADGSSAAAVVSLTGEALEEAAPGPERGFDVPAGWSPDGRYLVVNWFEGESARSPGRGHLVVIELGTRRQEVADKGNLEFIGWLPGASE